jgi:uncharacterized protein
VTSPDPYSADAVRAAYDQVAGDYAATFGDDLDRLPLDRDVLRDAVAVAAEGPAVEGWVVEVGCGPAPAAALLRPGHDRWLAVDLSAAMLRVAGERNPALRRAQADLRRLPLPTSSCAAVLAFYTLQHLPRADLAAGVGELARVLRPGGLLAVATHLGEGHVVMEEFLGHRIEPVAGAFHDRDEVVGVVEGAGMQLVAEHRRAALPHEHDSERLYVIARRTGH